MILSRTIYALCVFAMRCNFATALDDSGGTSTTTDAPTSTTSAYIHEESNTDDLEETLGMLSSDNNNNYHYVNYQNDMGCAFDDAGSAYPHEKPPGKAGPPPTTPLPINAMADASYGANTDTSGRDAAAPQITPHIPRKSANNSGTRPL